MIVSRGSTPSGGGISDRGRRQVGRTKWSDELGIEPDPRDARNQRLIQTTAGHEMLSELHRMTAEAELPTI